MLSINMSDVMNVISAISSQLIVIAIALVVGIAVVIGVRKIQNPTKKFIRALSWIMVLVVTVASVNSMLLGPLSTMLDLIGSKSGEISESTAAGAKALAIEIGEEGIVLMENDDSLLPLSAGNRLNVFGWGSTQAILGGAGSGGLNESFERTGIIDSLNAAGIETNTELTDFYTAYAATRPEVGMWSQDWTLPEPNVSLYTDSMLSNAKSFSDIAMVVITRSGGEGADLPEDMVSVVNGSYVDGTTYRNAVYDDSLNAGNDWDEGDHYLQLSNREEELIDLVCKNFDRVIVLYNGANAFEMGFVKEHAQIKSVLWSAGQGHVGMTALGEILSGKVNPSARLIDTYVYDMKSTPWWNNFGDFNYTNMDEFNYHLNMFGFIQADEIPSFVNYVEGIYVGYKFYETAAKEGFIDYDSVVQYPFGHGLSYTTFEQTMGEVTESNGKISFDVTVTNTGAVAGKEVVQVYVDPPYTNGGIEKASANLVEYAKTGLLQPGASEKVTISFELEDLMSYDYLNAKAYVLEAGDYVISINKDSHTVIDAKTYTVASEKHDKDSDVTKAQNLFDFAAGDVTYLSRKDHFANYDAATAAPTSYEMPADAKAAFYNNSNYLTAEATALDENAAAAAVTTGVNSNLQLVDLRGLEKDDPKWDKFMDQLTVEQMNSVTSLGGYQTNAVEAVGKIRTNDCDGPASINNNFTGQGSIGFPVGVMIAATWNKDLAYRFGESIGKMANEMDVSGWYAPAMNIHRTAFAGRNFEYYSEDPILSGYTAANAVKGSQDNGVYAYMKHFALNDQEMNRCDMLCTWSNEQAIREIYLRPFELCVKDSDCLAVMSSFNYIGNRWSGGCRELQTDVLRGEWGFRGFVETDYFGVYGYMNADQAIRNGSDLMLVNYPTETNDMRFTSTNGAKYALRNSVKNILYVVVNSRAYAPENYSTAMATWKKILIGCDIVAGLGICALGYFAVAKFLKRKKAKK
ncbi:MAG: glycoside hydrolase family 3 C-terminal domain-containing protein [Clostridia bacterium]|nr:glycoside hydrolase family 3 C-terminal domain-containing protein [Clostridia bacterium]